MKPPYFEQKPEPPEVSDALGEQLGNVLLELSIGDDSARQRRGAGARLVFWRKEVKPIKGSYDVYVHNRMIQTCE